MPERMHYADDVRFACVKIFVRDEGQATSSIIMPRSYIIMALMYFLTFERQDALSIYAHLAYDKKEKNAEKVQVL